MQLLSHAMWFFVLLLSLTTANSDSDLKEMQVANKTKLIDANSTKLGSNSTIADLGVKFPGVNQTDGNNTEVLGANATNLLLNTSLPVVNSSRITGTNATPAHSKRDASPNQDLPPTSEAKIVNPPIANRTANNTNLPRPQPGRYANAISNNARETWGFGFGAPFGFSGFGVGFGSPWFGGFGTPFGFGGLGGFGFGFPFGGFVR